MKWAKSAEYLGGYIHYQHVKDRAMLNLDIKAINTSSSPVLPSSCFDHQNLIEYNVFEFTDRLGDYERYGDRSLPKKSSMSDGEGNIYEVRFSYRDVGADRQAWMERYLGWSGGKLTADNYFNPRLPGPVRRVGPDVADQLLSGGREHGGRPGDNGAVRRLRPGAVCVAGASGGGFRGRYDFGGRHLSKLFVRL
jgi:hypothetical protein